MVEKIRQVDGKQKIRHVDGKFEMSTKNKKKIRHVDGKLKNILDMWTENKKN